MPSPITIAPGHARGISFMVLAVGTFALMDAMLKQLAGHYPPIQVSFLRCAASLPFVLVPIAFTGRWRRLRPVNLRLHLMRACFAVVMLWGFVWAVARATLTDVYAVFMSAPLVVLALAALFLGERIGPLRWAAVVLGMVGVIVTLAPSGEGMRPLVGVVALLAAFSYAASIVTVRVLARTDTTSSMVFWFLALVAVAAGLAALPGWVGIRGEHWTWILAVGLTGWVAQLLITEAFKLAPASVVAPFEYTALIWALCIDFAFWQALPSGRALVGATIVVAAGLLVLARERGAQA
ncbi:MAG: DMT family transporter [Steroidobacteraceae bacterium]